MNIETTKSDTTEVFTEGHNITVTATRWANCEGVNVMVLSSDGTYRSSFVLRWEELDVLMVALTAIRSE